jgi:hypothetical protein
MGMMMRAFDTSLEAHEVQVRLYRSMTGAQRSELALRMSDDVRQIAAEGIRQRHPEYNDADVQRALVALLYGREIARGLWPSESVREP